MTVFPRRALTGAWIETGSSGARTPAPACRALTGAWIETLRGGGTRQGNCGRALTGAWIETGSAARQADPGPVAPSRARGLKHPNFVAIWRAVVVAPSRARGLKLQRRCLLVRRALVAPSRARGLKLLAGRDSLTHACPAIQGARVGPCKALGCAEARFTTSPHHGPQRSNTEIPRPPCQSGVCDDRPRSTDRSSCTRLANSQVTPLPSARILSSPPPMPAST